MKSYRTFVFALVSVIGGIATMFGATIPPEVLDELAKNLEIVIGGLITAYGAAIFIFRAISSTPMFESGNPFAAARRTVVGWFSKAPDQGPMGGYQPNGSSLDPTNPPKGE